MAIPLFKHFFSQELAVIFERDRCFVVDPSLQMITRRSRVRTRENSNTQSPPRCEQDGEQEEHETTELVVGSTAVNVIDLDAESVDDAESYGSDLEFVGETSAQDIELHIVRARNPKRRRCALTPVKESRLSNGNSVLSSCTDENDGDVCVVGERTVLNSETFYSHFRFMCSAAEPCPKCFCYVCDISVSQCKNWGFHKRAKDNSIWRKKRARKVACQRLFDSILERSLR